MEEEQPSDPHEQQLFAVFKSCLVTGHNCLDKKGLLALCSKLELEDSRRDSILELLGVETDRRSVTFREFRDGFLALLGKSLQDQPKEVNGTMCERYGRELGERKQSENCQAGE